ncbi:uncharacterized protein LOC131930040 isoform X2 [Physella acuta]|uniref:uncharacterized protein LOC131930040 isoform X2 n=1 Tax=Physella acuta TaxID=109671 RepID=UPI0027DE16B7|nr:uncharacterized protein LOC131930040 isoform X2 [Physella acuta]
MATRIPINKDNYNFDDRQKKIWEDMERDMERRRREWEDEIDKMRKEFFHLRPESSDFGLEGTGSPVRLPGQISSRVTDTDDGKAVIEKDDNGQPVFRVRFNMKEYKPEEVNVKMDSTKIMVSARHEEKGSGSTVSREYSREVQIPRDVDPLALQCTLNPDGYLVVHAPLPAPNYSAIKDTSRDSNASPNVMKSTSSYQTSSTVSSKPQSTIITDVPAGFTQELPQTRGHLSSQLNTQPRNKPPPTFTPPSMFKHEELLSHPDHVTPSFKPPPDLSKLDMLENNQPRLINHPLHSVPPSHLSNSTFSKPPFNTLSSTFPSGSLFSEPSSQAQLSAPVVTSHDGKFQLTMPIDEFRPEELTVKTQDCKVIICAKREVSTGNRAQTMEMTREHSLPDNVDPLTVKAFFTDTNNLIVEAPFIRS